MDSWTQLDDNVGANIIFISQVTLRNYQKDVLESYLRSRNLGKHNKLTYVI